VRRPSAPQITLGLLIVAYVAVFGTLSLRRHQNLRTNALDLGYTDQTVWNTLNGRPFRFSTYLDAAFRLDIPIQDFRQPEILLGYHVEPILAPISLLYLLHDGPETLLWLQTVVIALGAIPVYLLARRRFSAHSDKPPIAWLPVAFAFLYLLSPSLQAANMSDFHAVALSPTLLLTAFFFLETDRPWGFLAFSFLAIMCKEEVGLVVAMMGLWAVFVRRRWALGLGTLAVATGWSLISVAVVMPHFSGLQSSPFLVRYGQFGDSPVAIVRNAVQQPGLLIDWLQRPDVLRYPRDLLLSTGGLSVLCPPCLLMAVPPLAINTFSAYGWMRSGGGHYSATIVPILVIAAIYGVDWLARQVQKWGDRHAARQGAGTPAWATYEAASLALVGLGLVVALVNYSHNGIGPLSRRYELEPITEHAQRAQAFIDRVNNLPSDVPISASSSLYPHVAHRERVYLFPTISDAQYILLDTTGPGSPTGMGDQRIVVRELMDYTEFGVADSDHGLLLLERGLDNYLLPPDFYEAFLAAQDVGLWRVAALAGIRLGCAPCGTTRTGSSNHNVLAGACPPE